MGRTPPSPETPGCWANWVAISSAYPSTRHARPPTQSCHHEGYPSALQDFAPGPVVMVAYGQRTAAAKSWIAVASRSGCSSERGVADAGGDDSAEALEVAKAKLI
jgi:hypothetical protein